MKVFWGVFRRGGGVAFSQDAWHIVMDVDNLSLLVNDHVWWPGQSYSDMIRLVKGQGTKVDLWQVDSSKSYTLIDISHQSFTNYANVSG